MNAAALLSIYMAVQSKELCNSLANGRTITQEKLMEQSHLADHTTRTLKCTAEASGGGRCAHDRRPESPLVEQRKGV